MNETLWMIARQENISINQRIQLFVKETKDFPKCDYCGKYLQLRNKKTVFYKYCSKYCGSLTGGIMRLNNIEELQINKESEIIPYDLFKETLKEKYDIKTNRADVEVLMLKHKLYSSLLFYTKDILYKTASLQQRAYVILNDIKSLPECKAKDCINKVGFVGCYLTINTFCSRSCSSKYMSSSIETKYYKETGYMNTISNPSVREKIKEVCLTKYGGVSPWSDSAIRDKCRKTSIERHGIDFHANTTNGSKPNGFLWYEYILPSGKVIDYQGYENKYIPVLIRKYGEENIVFNKTEIPTISYILDGVNRRYFPDFYVPSENLLIEIKSTYTLEKEYDKNMAKFDACRAQGYKLKVKVFKKPKKRENKTPLK